MSDRDESSYENEDERQEWEYDEPAWEDFLDDEEEEMPVPFWQQPKVRKGLAVLVALMMLANVIAFLPQIISIPVIQFLVKSRELSQNEDVQQYKRAVVTVKSENRKGTGFYIGGQGWILTNDHVVGSGVTESIVTFGDGDMFNADVVARDSGLDMAVLQIEAEQKPSLSLAADVDPESGDSVYVIGNPLYFNRIVNEGDIWGMLSNRDPPLIAIQAPIYKGNSGSPVINDEGDVIAVVFATTRVDRNGENIRVGLSVPIPAITDRFPRIRQSEGE